MHGGLEKRCGPGDAEAGRHGTREFCRRAAGEVRKYGALEVYCRRGDVEAVEAWRSESLEVRYSVGTWRHGCMGV